MLKRSILLISSVIALAGSHQAIAVTFDFATIANSGEYGASSITFNDASGLNVTATGFDSNNNSLIYNAYLDSSWFHSGPGAPGGNGGLGICKTLTASAQCSPSSDDNVTSFESLRLLFNQEVTINQLVFRNGNHGEDFDGQFTLAMGNAPATLYDLTHIFDTPLTGTDFIFTNINADTNTPLYLYEFYISSMEVTAVPVPAAAWLFASGVLGLVGAARRRNS